MIRIVFFPDPSISIVSSINMYIKLKPLSFVRMMNIPLLLLFSVAAINSYEIDSNVQAEENDGKFFYGELIEKAQSYGGCWKEAMADIDSSCRALTEKKNSRLALSFSNCFLKHAGLRPISCHTNELISNCLKHISREDLNTYNAYFIHTQSICHYLQHREWQEEIAKTVLILTENMRNVTKMLDETAISQSKLLDLQQTSIMQQKEHILSGEILNTELQQSRKSVQDLHNEFTSIAEQKLMLFGTFDEVKRLINYVLGFFYSWITVGYFLLGGVFSVILTSPCQTAKARWPMLIAIVASYVPVYLVTISEVDLANANEILYERIWWCIKLCGFLWTIILMYYYYHYKDHNAVICEQNEQMRKEMQQTREEMQQTKKEILKLQRRYVNAAASMTFKEVEKEDLVESLARH